MISDCTMCTRKHLATAITYSHEAVLGYPIHAWLCVGELVNAENEMLRADIQIARTIREYRLQYMDCIEEDFKDLVRVPNFLDLILLVTSYHDIQKQEEKETADLFNQTDK